jgi:hypothetical protein
MKQFFQAMHIQHVRKLILEGTEMHDGGPLSSISVFIFMLRHSEVWFMWNNGLVNCWSSWNLDQGN